MNLKNLFQLLILVIPFPLLAQDISHDLESEIQRRVELKINPSIAIGILMPSGEEKYYNYGSPYGDEDFSDSLSLYEIGSVTKTFTSILTDKYLNASLNQPVSDFFEKINNRELTRIHLEEIRNHISGLPRLSTQFSPEDWSDPFNGYSNHILEQELKALQPDSSKNWSYSNFGYGVLGRTIEKKTGRDFEKLMGNLLDEIGLSNTYLTRPENRKMVQPTNIGTENKHWNFTGPSRYAGGLISCTSDLIEYLKFQQQNNSLFNSVAIEEPIPTGINSLGEDDLFYKKGWFVLKPDEGTEILLHNGGTGGFTSFVAFNKKTKTGVVMLSNSVSLVDDLGLKILYPDFELNKPERTIAYELAELIENGVTTGLVEQYRSMKKEDYPTNIFNIYWLERFNFGINNWEISDQLSDIIVSEIPEDWEAWDLKGQNLEKLQRYPEAEKAYRKALELNPGNEQLIQKITRCEKLQG